MAYDGIFFKALSEELKSELLGRRLEKIHQHSANSMSFGFARLKQKWLYIDISGHAPRVLLSENKSENPVQAPMFCMLLRKHLSGAVLQDIVQINSDRILEFVFEGRNEMKDVSKKSLVLEIMGRHSNAIFLDENRLVVDSLKHVNPLISSRAMGPGYTYAPPFDAKIDLLQSTLDNDKNFDLYKKLEELCSKSTAVHKEVYRTFAGLSPQIAISLIIGAGITKTIKEAKAINGVDLSLEDRQAFGAELEKLVAEIKSGMRPYALVKDKKIEEISSVDLNQYEMIIESKMSFSALAEWYFEKKGRSDLLNEQKKSLSDLIAQSIAREENRIAKLSQDLKNAKELEDNRLCGELITANMHLIKKGFSSVNLLNYYSGEEIAVKLNDRLSPAENADAYFKRYQKMKRTLVIAREQIDLALERIEHLESVAMSVEQAETSEDISAIKLELAAAGLIKKPSIKKSKKHAKLKPREFKTPNGHILKIGRNNEQNDELSLKTASKKHLWLHTKDIPSAHAIIFANEDEIGAEDIVYAAGICAHYSRARESENVPVDYTQVKNVSKPSGAKPGKVIYVKQKTVYVNPICP